MVVLNWKRQNDTLECLESIKKLAIQDFELNLIVVDNASKDDSVKTFQEFFKKIKKETPIKAKLIENEKNLGFAGGNNAGIKYSLEKAADFVLILNNDTSVHRHLVTKFLESAKKHKEGGIFSPKIYFAPGYEFHKERYKEEDLGEVIWYAGGKFSWNNILGTNRGVDEVDHGQYDKTIKIDFAAGACAFIRREVLETVGLFDERYFLYLEDVDLSHRAKLKNWKILYVPQAHLWHKVSASSQIGGGLQDYYITRNRLLFGIKYAPFRTKVALLREALGLLIGGREWQKMGVVDFFVGRLGQGSFRPR